MYLSTSQACQEDRDFLYCVTLAAAALSELTGFFIETWLKFPNNLTRFKIGYDETTGLYFMSGSTEMGYEVMKSIDIMR